jgi:hypothetical protein
MNSICITGYLLQDLGLVEEILKQAGMQTALPAQRDSSMSISFWHQQVEALLAKENYDASDAPSATTNLGRLWEQLASDIFISNLQSQTWGWADTRSRPLLSFWKNFDPQLRFVLVVCSPERLIAHAIESSNDVPNVEQLLKQWQSYTEALLAFYKDNPKRCIFVNVQDCIDQPAVFLQTLNKKLGMQLNKVHFPNITELGFSDLTRYLAAGFVQAAASDRELTDKLYKSIALNSSDSRRDVIPSHTELMKWYRKMQGDLLQKGQEQIDLQAKHNKLTERLDQERATSADLSAQNVALERKQKELTNEIDSVRTDCMRLKQSHSHLQEELKNLKDIKTSFSSGGEGNDQQRGLLKETRDQLGASQKLLGESNLRHVAAEKSHNEQTATANDFSAKLTKANSQLNAYASIEKDLKEENELLLLQLHQVQEELDTYFQKYQDVRAEVERVQSRWRRMLVRNPDYCDVESLDIESVAQDNAQRTTWKIKGMDAGGRHIPDISFVTFIEKGVAGFEFSRVDNGSAGLLRWPATLAEEQTLTIAMGGDAKAREKRALAIIGLATSDWSLIAVLIGFLTKALQSPSLLKVPQNFDATGLIKALDKLETNLKALSDVLRYDKVKLKREQVNPDYEHLWFSFENMTAAGKLIGDFEYRISCTNVRPKKFGDHPKLEFPEETCKTAMQNWFEESYDDYGAKLELRFALPDSMDMEVWGKLSLHDQLFIRDLIRQLPYVLDDLRLSGNKPKRGWEDWKVLVSDTQRVLNMRAEPSGLLPVTLKKRSAAVRTKV